MRLAFKTSLLKLALVGVLFYTSYGLPSHYTVSLAYVPEIAFVWERGIPSWAWIIIPYWSLSLMYAAALSLCRNACEQNRYAARLLAARIVATICFMLSPLHFGWPKPPTDGLWGWLFDSLVASDLPYNRAPSLHIALAVIVGAFCWMWFPKIRLPIPLWQSPIALSALTIYQHHFIGVPTGALLGWLVLWAIPQHGISPFKRPFGTQGRLKTNEANFCEAKMNTMSFARTNETSFREIKTSPEACSQEVKITVLYLADAVLSALPSLLGSAWLWMLRVNVSLSVVAFAYLTGNTAVFQKQADGRLLAAATILLLPYLTDIRLNMAHWLNGKVKTVQVRDGVWIGNISGISGDLSAVLNVCTEYPCPRYRGACRVLPLLDMVASSENDSAQAALLLGALRRQRSKVLTYYALGYGHSAAVVLTWLLVYGGRWGLTQATAGLKQARPQMMPPPETAKVVEATAGCLKASAVSFVKTSEASSSEAKTNKASFYDANRDN